MTRIRILAILACGLLSLSAMGQSRAEFMSVRKRAGISNLTLPENLSRVIGKRSIEISGMVKGIVGSDVDSLMLIEVAPGQTLYVSLTKVPEYLRMGDVRVRLIVDATRDSETAELKTKLVIIVREEDAPPMEPTATVRSAPSSGRNNRSSYVSASRGGPRPMQGEIRVTQDGTQSAQVAAPTQTSPSDDGEWRLPVSEAAPFYAAYVKRINRRVADEEAMRVAEAITGYSMKYGVDARLIMAIVQTESDFNKYTRSRAGAMGYGQLMPSNVAELGLRDVWDTTQNLWGTVKLIRGHLDDYAAKEPYERLVFTLAAYNAGPGNVKKYGGVPPFRETQNYVRKVIGTYQSLCGGDVADFTIVSTR